jgi:hypothetical protein
MAAIVHIVLSYCSICIGNLPFSTTDEELAKLFSAAGTVKSAKIIRDKFSGRSKACFLLCISPRILFDMCLFQDGGTHVLFLTRARLRFALL